MDNIIEQRITDNEIYLRATNGKEFHWRRDDVRTKQQEELDKRGSTRREQEEAREATLTSIREAVVKALGYEMINAEDIYFDFDDRDGKPLDVALGKDMGLVRGRRTILP